MYPCIQRRYLEKNKKIFRYSHEEAQTYLYLEKYLPNFVKLLDPSPRQLVKIRQKIELRNSQVNDELVKSGIFNAETTLIDLIWKAEERDLHSIQFIGYIDKACSVIENNISSPLLPKLRRTLMQLVMNFDSAKSRYRSYIAELSVLSTLIKGENLKLVEVEYELPNAKSADYAFQGNKGIMLVEIESFDLSLKEISTDLELSKYMNNRVERKLRNKLKGLPRDWNIPFYLIQVIWADYMKLSKFKEYFKKPTKYPNIVLQPMLIVQFFDREKEIPRYMFLCVDKLLKIIEEMHQ